MKSCTARPLSHRLLILAARSAHTHTHVGSNISVPYCFVKLRVTVVALGDIIRSAQRSLSCERE